MSAVSCTILTRWVIYLVVRTNFSVGYFIIAVDSFIHAVGYFIAAVVSFILAVNSFIPAV